MRQPTVFAALVIAGCATAPPSSRPASSGQPAPPSARQASPEPATAASAAPNHASGVTDPKLADLLQRHWEYTLATSPLYATHLGDHRFDAELGDNSLRAIEAHRAANRAFLAEARSVSASSDDEAPTLSVDDEITLTLFVRGLEDEIAAEKCRFEEWTLSPRQNPITELNYLPDLHKIRSYADAERLLKRFQQAGQYIDNQVSHLTRGVEAGLFANAESTRRVLKMVSDQLAQPILEWPMYAPARADRPDWTPEQTDRFRHGLTETLTDGVKPALQRYHDFIDARILPRARGDDRPGLSPLPFAAACYQARIHAHTTLPKTAKELHETGLAEIERINGLMKTLGAKLFGEKTLAGLLKRLRNDRKLYFASADAIENKAKQALSRARNRIPDYFGILPQADCVVARIPAYEAPFTTIAYYRQPDPTGDRPGQYYINVYQPQTRPRFEMEALAFHESIPGHHLQIAIAQERSELPAFRRHIGLTAFVEGWALYTEQLADEMGLYSGDLDRMGMLSYEAWRAARLVVDTGLHAMGWSRAEAERFMLEHTALAPNNINNEVDRYIVWPAQALAYKTGQLEIWRLRREAERRLKDRFDIKGFHDAVLGGGSVSLPVLQRQVDAWVRSVANATGAGET